MSVISLTERDGQTEVTATAAMRIPATAETVILLDLAKSPLLTPGIDRGAVRGVDYTTNFSRNSITIPPGSLSGATTFAIDPTYDTRTEGDEAIILTGRAARLAVAPTDLIVEDGPYLSFPRSIYGSFNYPGQPISISVEAAVHRSSPSGAVTYALTDVEPRDNPLGLTFDPDTRRLAGQAPPSAAVPQAGLTARYTITARDGAGHQATTLISVAVVNDVCSATASTWFGSGSPPAELVRDCNVLLASRDVLSGTGTLNWATDTPITTPWDGLQFHTDVMWIRKIELQLRNLNGTIPPVLGHLSSPGSLDLVLGGDYRETDPALENKLTGEIPPELGLPPNLIVLALSFNNLSGPIPRELASNGKLRFLYLQDTDKSAPDVYGHNPPGVSGPIPPVFGDLPMRGLNITGNRHVTGHIPWQLGKIVSSGQNPGLQVLSLYENNLTGRIPWQLGRFGKIQQLSLSHNQLTGGIPWQLGNLGNEEADLDRRIVNLYLNGNRLSGGIPPELANIANLETLSLSENWLTGQVPARLGGLPKLRHLFLRDNWLTGGIPPELAGIDALADYNNLYNLPDAGDARLSALWLSGAEIGAFSPLRGDYTVTPPYKLASTTVSARSARSDAVVFIEPPDADPAIAGHQVAIDGETVISVWVLSPDVTRTRAYRVLVKPATVDVTLSRSLAFPDRYFISTRPQGEDWTTHDVAVELDALRAAGRFQLGGPVSLAVAAGGLKPARLDVIVWRSVRFPDRHFVSTRPGAGAWATHNTVIRLTGLDASGRFRQGGPVAVEIDLR